MPWEFILSQANNIKWNFKMIFFFLKLKSF